MAGEEGVDAVGSMVVVSALVATSCGIPVVSEDDSGGLGQGGRDTTDDTVGTTGTTAYTGEPLSFAILDELPIDAVDSGYRNFGRELWMSESGDYVYMRSVAGVERWPLISPKPLCVSIG